MIILQYAYKLGYFKYKLVKWPLLFIHFDPNFPFTNYLITWLNLLVINSLLHNQFECKCNIVSASFISHSARLQMLRFTVYHLLTYHLLTYLLNAPELITKVCFDFMVNKDYWNMIIKKGMLTNEFLTTIVSKQYSCKDLKLLLSHALFRKYSSRLLEGWQV